METLSFPSLITFSKLKALHIKQESILEKKKGHLESINSARLSSKKALAKAVDNKDLQEGRAHREHEAQEYLLRENERLYANLGAAQLKNVRGYRLTQRGERSELPEVFRRDTKVQSEWYDV